MILSRPYQNSRRLRRIIISWYLLDDFLKGNLRPTGYRTNLPESAQIVRAQANNGDETVTLLIYDELFDETAIGAEIPVFVVTLLPKADIRPTIKPPQLKA